VKERIMIRSVYMRSGDAEGNPMHKSFSRAPADKQPLGVEGIVASFDWHRDRQVTERQGAGRHPHDRALLIQTVANLELLARRFPSLESLREPSSFGENLLLEGASFSPSQLCVGDVLSVSENGIVVAVLQITSPRWPCYKVDKRHPLPSELQGEERVRGVCCASGWGGFFAKVLQPGSIGCGNSVEVTSRPQPQWTLERVSKVFYGGANRKTAMLDVWNGTEEELHECLELSELAEFEWRDRLKQYVAKRAALKEKNRAKWKLRILVASIVVALVAVLWSLNLKQWLPSRLVYSVSK
jgi:MOSC domain-containing protein YiiM